MGRLSCVLFLVGTLLAAGRCSTGGVRRGTAGDIDSTHAKIPGPEAMEDSSANWGGDEMGSEFPLDSGTDQPERSREGGGKPDLGREVKGQELDVDCAARNEVDVPAPVDVLESSGFVDVVGGELRNIESWRWEYFDAPPFFEYPPPECKDDDDCLEYDDGDKCNGIATCQDGKCVYDVSTVVICPPAEYQCTKLFCIPDSGLCAISAADDGTLCDDGNPETLMDVCLGANCIGLDPMQCDQDTDCDDLYSCTIDTCQGGTCVHTANTCGPPDPSDCMAAKCNHETGCSIVKYEDKDKTLYFENFDGGLARGWDLSAPGYVCPVVKALSGAKGVLMSAGPKVSIETHLPPLYLPPTLLYILAGVELTYPAACDGLSIEILLDDESLIQIQGCDLAGKKDPMVGTALPVGTKGEAVLGFRVTNAGPVTSGIVLTSVRVEMQGGEACCADLDQDKTWDCLDNCIGVPNPGQEDCDGDGVGDLCDQDADNDGVENKFDEWECDPGASLAVRRVAERRVSPFSPTAVACSQANGGCFVLGDSPGSHLFMDLYGEVRRLIRFDEFHHPRSATVCNGHLWVLDAGATVYGYDISDPSRPKKVYTFNVPPELMSLNQSLACWEGDLLLSSGHFVYVLEAGGETDLFYDVLEEIWGLEVAGEYLIALTRSPQQPFHFYLRMIKLGEKQTIIPLKSEPDELKPTCQFEDIGLAGWGGPYPGGALWVALSGCARPLLELRDPWQLTVGGGDADGDGLGDLVDQDDDGDGVPDLVDVSPLDPMAAFDADQDGYNDFQDLDEEGSPDSDNYGPVGGAQVSVLSWTADPPAVGLSAQDDGLLLVGGDGVLRHVSSDGWCIDQWEAPGSGWDSVATSQDEFVLHDATTRGIARFAGGLQNATPRLWLDSPERGYGISGKGGDVAIADGEVWVGVGGHPNLNRLDASGNVTMAVRLPGQFRGVAAAGGKLFVLVAPNQNDSALLRLDRSGRLLGWFMLKGWSLHKLAAGDEHTLYTLPNGPSTGEIAKIALPKGYLELEQPAIDAPGEGLDPGAALAPYVPTATTKGKVTVKWPKTNLPQGTQLEVCWSCPNPAGFIPPQNCIAANPANGLVALSDLPDGVKCGFELRTHTPAGIIASRRVSITVGDPSSGNAVWTKEGTMNTTAWRLTVIPFLLKL